MYVYRTTVSYCFDTSLSSTKCTLDDMDIGLDETSIIRFVFSLLDILAARKDPQGLTGEVLINGHPQPSNFRLMSGYVVQDDVVMGTLSVRENLRFSADLRLPRDITEMEREAKVNRVISELSLGRCFISLSTFVCISCIFSL